jgi:hypothetical protein
VALKLDKTALVKNLVKNHKLVPHLDKYIGAGEFSWSADFDPKVGDDAFHPSGHCTPTLNELYKMASGQLHEAPLPVSLRKTFMVGHFWHAYIQYIVQELGFADESAIERRGEKVWAYLAPPGVNGHRPKPFHWATGSGDIAPCVIPGHGEFLVDIKTMGSHDYKRNGLPDWAAAKYECQINVYMDWFQQERAIILAVQKDSPHEMKEFHFERNNALIDSIYKKWELVSTCLDEGIEPPEDEDFYLPIAGPTS